MGEPLLDAAPVPPPLTEVIVGECGPVSAGLCPKQFDIFLFWHIIDITDERLQRCQTPPSPPTRGSAPSPRSSHRCTVPRQQFFRPRRLNPGQIRDAAPGRCRTGSGQPGSARSWTLAAFVLPSPSRLATKRSGGIDPAQARTARSPQVDRSGIGFSGSAASQPTRSEVRRVSPAGPTTTGCDSSSTNDRTGAIPASKKTPLNTGAWQPAPESGMLRERYEQIREQSLERSAIGIGSEVVMRRGMRSWMEADWRQEVGPVAAALPAGGLQPDLVFQQIVTVWASVLVSQAERSYGG